MGLKDSTKQKYKQIANRFQEKFLEFGFRNNKKIKISELNILFEEFLFKCNTKNSFRCAKAGLNYWIVGYCQKITPDKRKKIRNILNKALTTACGEVDKKKTFTKRKGYRYRSPLTEQKLTKILGNNKINKKHKYLLSLMLLSGARPNEIKNLKIENFSNSVFFEKIISKKSKMRIKKTKLKYKIEDLQSFFQKYNLNLNEFLYYQNKIRYNEDTIRKIFSRISQKIKTKIIPYSCRNFFSAEIKKILIPEQVAQALGHESFRNQTYYANSKSTSPLIPIPIIKANFDVKGEQKTGLYFNKQKNVQDSIRHQFDFF